MPFTDVTQQASVFGGGVTHVIRGGGGHKWGSVKGRPVEVEPVKRGPVEATK